MLLKFLPLKDDLEENDTVYGCILKLYQSGDATILQSLPNLLAILADQLDQPQLKECKKVMLGCLGLLLINLCWPDPRL